LARDFYRAELIDALRQDPIQAVDVRTPTGTQIAKGAPQLVVGDYGAYLEFTEAQMIRENLRPKWTETPTRPVKYIWHVPTAGAPIRIYEQKRTVRYAAYVPGRWYVAPQDVLLYRVGE